MSRRRKYATRKEALAAKKAQQAAYRAARKAGTWVRKNRVFSTRIARKAGILTEQEKARASKEGLDMSTRTAWQTSLRRKEYEKQKRQQALEEKKKYIREKFGFEYGVHLNRPLTEKEIEGRKAWEREKSRAEYQRHKAKRQKYNRDYRRKRRAAELVEAQKVWTAAEWEAWQKRQESKSCGPGTPAYFVSAVVKLLAEQAKMSEESMMDTLLTHGAVDFLVRGAESIGRARATNIGMIRAAARAVAFFIDPAGAVMFPEKAAPPENAQTATKE